MADHPHTIDRWDDATGENLIEQIAAAGSYTVALETYRAAVKRWPKDKITCATGRGSEQSWREDFRHSLRRWDRGCGAVIERARGDWRSRPALVGCRIQRPM